MHVETTLPTICSIRSPSRASSWFHEAVEGADVEARPNPAVLRAQSPSPLFFHEWYYVSDPVYENIVTSCRNGKVLEDYRL